MIEELTSPALKRGVFMGETRPATQQERRQARAFARWQKTARERKGWGIPQLSAASGYSDTHLRKYDADGDGGMGPANEYKQPVRKYVVKIAEATGADLNEGLISAGLLKVVDADPDDPIRVLPGYRRREIVLSSGRSFPAAIPDDVTDEELEEYETIAQTVRAARQTRQNDLN